MKPSNLKPSALTTIALIILLAAGLSACTMPQDVPAGGADDFASYLNDIVPELMDRYRVPGASVALISGGEVVWSQGYGLADTESLTPVTDDTVFQVASISKAVTAWGVMRLVEEGAIELSAPVEDYLTRWHLPESIYDASGVTVERLLSHTAGISLHGYRGVEPGEPLPSLEESLSGATYRSQDVYIAYEPGEAWHYSGGGYTLLQLMVEEVTGQSFEAYMQQVVLDPLGMADSRFVWTADIQGQTASAYDWWGRQLPNYLFTPKAAAGLYTTGPDLAQFVAAAMVSAQGEPAGRGVLSPETVARMMAPVDATGGIWGLGYAHTSYANRIDVTGHGGANEGWKAQFAMRPESGDGIVILTNSDRGTDLNRDVLCLWVAWISGSPVDDVCTTGDRMTPPIVAGALALGLVAFAVTLVKGLRAGRRKFGWRFSWRRMLWLAAFVVLLVGWWVGFYTGVVFVKYMPSTFGWVTGTVTAWMLALIASTFMPRVRRRVRRKRRQTQEG